MQMLRLTALNWIGFRSYVAMARILTDGYKKQFSSVLEKCVQTVQCLYKSMWHHYNVSCVDTRYILDQRWRFFHCMAFLSLDIIIYHPPRLQHGNDGTGT